MRRFPAEVRDAMSRTGAASTCLPVKFETDRWETAVFLQLGGPECKQDRKILGQRAVPLGIESDLIGHSNAAIIVLRFEVYTSENDPYVGEVLLTPGEGSVHFQTMKLLTEQPRLRWFFGDRQHWVLREQEHPLGTVEHDEFRALLNAATHHDALARITGRYDARAALGEVVANYEIRTSARLSIPGAKRDDAKN